MTSLQHIIGIAPPPVKRFLISVTERGDVSVVQVSHIPPQERTAVQSRLEQFHMEYLGTPGRWDRPFERLNRAIECARELAESLKEEVYFVDGEAYPSPVARIIGVTA